MLYEIIAFCITLFNLNFAAWTFPSLMLVLAHSNGIECKTGCSTRTYYSVHGTQFLDQLAYTGAHQTTQCDNGPGAWRCLCPE